MYIRSAIESTTLRNRRIRNGPFVACRPPLIGLFVIEQRRTVTGLPERHGLPDNSE